MPDNQCPSCAFDNSENAKFCSQCGKQLDLGVPTPNETRERSGPHVDTLPDHALQANTDTPAEYTSAKPFANLSPFQKAGLAVICCVGFFGIIAAIAGSKSEPGSTTGNTGSASSSPAQPARSAPSIPPTPKTAADYLSEGKSYLREIQSQSDLDAARQSLERIQKDAPEYKEAQALIAGIRSGKIKAPSEFERANSDIIRECKMINPDVTYAKLKKNAENYVGETWAFTGKILEIQEQGNYTVARVGMGSWGMDAVFVEGNFATDFVENDRVFVIGRVTHNKTYETVAGWTLTIPYVQAKAMLSPADGARLRKAAQK